MFTPIYRAYTINRAKILNQLLKIHRKGYSFDLEEGISENHLLKQGENYRFSGLLGLKAHECYVPEGFVFTGEMEDEPARSLDIEQWCDEIFGTEEIGVKLFRITRRKSWILAVDNY